MKPNPEEIIEMHTFVTGRVQGVGFRKTTRCYGARLGLRGLVTNLPDGRVEIRALGTLAQFDELFALLRADDGAIRIDDIQSEYFPLTNSYPLFEI
jgi:acylphosphatase